MLRKSLRSPMGARYNYAPFSKLPFGFIKTRQNKLSHNRFGVIVSKNVDKRAVARNRLRRAVAACVSGIILPYSGIDFIFILNRKAALFPEKDFCETLIRHLKQKGV